jgi:hypothetical protein
MKSSSRHFSRNGARSRAPISPQTEAVEAKVVAMLAVILAMQMAAALAAALRAARKALASQM